jgi:class 3 adenylate cyclase
MQFDNECLHAMNRIVFSPDQEPIRHAIAASFDMSGFSKFCQRHDAHAYLNRYLSHLFKAFDDAFEDGWRDFFKDAEKLVQVPRPDFVKYTGDGAIVLWVRDSGEEFSNDFCTSVVAALRNFQTQLPGKVSQWEMQWKALNFPRLARFGIATGPVHPLSTRRGSVLLDTGEVVDHAGYCINLAVRLQDHCPDVGFIVHAPVQPQLKGMVQLKALKMKGSMDEPVFVFESDYQRASASVPKEIKSKFAVKIT